MGTHSFGGPLLQYNYAHIHCLKKVEGADVLGFDCTIIIPEQEDAIQFLLIGLFALNIAKNRQNNFFFHKRNMGYSSQSHSFRYATQASPRIGGVIVSSRHPLSLDLTRI